MLMPNNVGVSATCRYSRCGFALVNFSGMATAFGGIFMAISAFYGSIFSTDFSALTVGIGFFSKSAKIVLARFTTSAGNPANLAT